MGCDAGREIKVDDKKWRVRTLCKLSCRKCRGDEVERTSTVFQLDQLFPTGCGREIVDGESRIRFYHGQPTTSAEAGESYLSYENSPFTPACKRFSSSTCDANSELVQASRIAVDSEEGDAPNLVYAGPECASAGSNANRNLGGDVVVVPTAPPFAGDYRPVSSCTRGEFACWNNRDYVSDGCISKRYLCDGDNDCGDDSDEHGCPGDGIPRDDCKRSEFACFDGGHSEGSYAERRWGDGCISKENVCNGINDCGDNSDESGCPSLRTPDCRGREFACANGFAIVSSGCIKRNWVCDGANDCGDNSDEAGCPESSTDSYRNDDDDKEVNCIGRCDNRDDDDLTDQEWKTKRNKKIGIGFGVTIAIICCLAFAAEK
eukprot:gene6127-34038_t